MSLTALHMIGSCMTPVAPWPRSNPADITAVLVSRVDSASLLHAHTSHFQLIDGCLQVPEECPEEVDLLIQQCLEKEVSRRPNAKQVYNTMMTVLQGEGGLPNEPVRVVNTDPTWGSSPSTATTSSSTTASTFDSAGSKLSSRNGTPMSTLT